MSRTTMPRSIESLVSCRSIDPVCTEERPGGSSGPPAVRIHHRPRRSCHDGEPMGPEPWTDDRELDRARSPEARRKLAEHQQRIYVPLLLSALLPIVVAASNSATDSRVSIVVNV